MPDFSSHINSRKHTCAHYPILIMICVTSLHLVFYCYILGSVIWDFNMTGNMRFVPLIGPHMFSFMTHEANFAEST